MTSHATTKLNNIYLVGLMGAGKTTVGKLLAAGFNMEFVDSDHEIEARTGANIPLIFDIEGEAGFRRWEKMVIDDLTQREGIVLATGGGAVLDEENRNHLRQRGIVIYLHASAEQLYQRTARDRNRPLLQTEDPKARLEALLEVRDPLYSSVADIIQESGAGSVHGVVRKLTSRLKRMGIVGGESNKSNRDQQLDENT